MMILLQYTMNILSFLPPLPPTALFYFHFDSKTTHQYLFFICQMQQLSKGFQVIDGFLSEQECETLVSACESRDESWEPPEWARPGETYHFQFVPPEADEAVLRVEEKIAKLVNVSVNIPLNPFCTLRFYHSLRRNIYILIITLLLLIESPRRFRRMKGRIML